MSASSFNPSFNASVKAEPFNPHTSYTQSSHSSSSPSPYSNTVDNKYAAGTTSSSPYTFNSDYSSTSSATDPHPHTKTETKDNTLAQQNLSSSSSSSSSIIKKDEDEEDDDDDAVYFLNSSKMKSAVVTSSSSNSNNNDTKPSIKDNDKNSSSSSSSSSDSSSSMITPPIVRQVLACPDCKNSEIIQDYAQGVNSCGSCGLVVSNIISESSEWRSFADDSGKDNNNRVGGPESSLMEEIGLSSMIASTDEYGADNTLSRLQNQQALTPKVRQLLEGTKRSKKLANALSLPHSIVEKCNELYKLVIEQDIKAKKHDAVIAACMMMALRAERVPRTLKEICAVASCTTKEVGRCFNRMKELKIHKKLSSTTSAPSAASYIERFCNILKLPPNISKAAIYIYARAEAKQLIKGQNPATLAGAATFMATNLTNNHKRQLNNVAHICGMSASTLLKAYSDIFYPNRRDGLVDDKFANIADIERLPPPENIRI